jgi:hypothetical protein
MLRYIGIIAGTTLLVLSGCDRLSPNEEKVVGTWEKPDGSGPRFIFSRDHTLATLFRGDRGEWTLLSEGTWRLDGNDIVEEFEFTYREPHPGETPHVFRGRTTVTEFQENKLILEKPVETLVRVK